MTAPDPRLEEIEGRANNPFSPENTRGPGPPRRDAGRYESRRRDPVRADGVGTVTPFDPDAPLPNLHLPVRGLGIETVEEVEDDE